MKFLIAVASLVAATPALAADLITKQSAHDVPTTVDRLVAAIEGAGATVFARIDHAGGAEKAGLELAPVEMVMFGNPKLGTPVMQADPAAGLDLPMRVVVYQAADGSVALSYHDPAALAEDHGIAADAEVLGKIAGALDKLTGAAVAE